MVRGYENIKLDNVTMRAALQEEAAIVMGHTQNDQEASSDGGQ
jgi:hypothetical protein